MVAVAADETVAEATEAAARRVMARRAALKDNWLNRVERRALMAEANDLLEEFNLITLGR